MHYLVTGGAGFIGSHLCAALLAADHQVTVLDDFSTGKFEHIWQGVRCVRGDAADPHCVEPLVAECDGVFHLAAIASVDRSLSEWRTCSVANSLATITVLDAISKLDIAVPCVLASSAAVYGDNPALPLDIMYAPNPLTAYGVDKYSSELHARIGTQIHHIPTSAMRFFNVYGERQDPHSPYSGVISIFAARMLAGEDVLIHGDGGQSRDFIYVGDVVQQLCAAMQMHHDEHTPSAYIHNVCTGIETTITELAGIMAELTEYETAPIHVAPKQGDIYRSLGTASLALDASVTTLKQGLSATLQWMTQYEVTCA